MVIYIQRKRKVYRERGRVTRRSKKRGGDNNGNKDDEESISGQANVGHIR